MEISEYQEQLSAADAKIGERLQALITECVPEAMGKVWHGHPVWFINQNPVVGYSLKKAGIEVLFWSGQSFGHTGLRAIGKFKAAGFAIASLPELDEVQLRSWLEEAKEIQWDYANLPKKRTLEKLTKF